MAHSDTSSFPSQVIVFRLGTDEYAMPIGVVKEIVRMQQVQRTSSPQPWARGVINLRGDVLPVHDLACRLDGTAREGSDDDATRILVTELDGGARQVGYLVTDVEEIRSVSPDNFSPRPVDTSPMIGGIVHVDERLVVLLDPDRLAGEGDDAPVVERAA